jgi:hypothetical protein
LRKRRDPESAKFFFIDKTYAPGIGNPVFLGKTCFVLEDEVKNPVSLVCGRPGLTDRVISGEELLIDKSNLMRSVGN